MIRQWILALLVAGMSVARAADMTDEQIRQSALDFVHEAIPAIAKSGDIKELTRRAPHLLTPSPVYTQRIATSLKTTSQLGKVISYGEPMVSVIRVGNAPNQSLIANIAETVTYAKGSVTFAGMIDKSALPWAFSSFDVQPQGDARTTLTWGRPAGISVPWALYAGVEDEPAIGDATAYLLSAELDSKYFDELDLEITDPAQRDVRAKDGLSRLQVVGSGLYAIMTNPQLRKKYYPVIQEWRAKEPQSGPAAMTEAIYWIKYAWDARGAGFSDSVTEAGQNLFEQRLRKAEAILLASKTYASNNPLWYATYLYTELGLGDTGKVQQTFVEGIKRYPYADAIYYKETRFLQPRWYGSYEQEDAMIRLAAELTRAKEGEGFYTLLYMRLTTEEGGGDFEIFRDSKASWPHMKQGFEDLMQRHPDSLWLANNYAAYACQANDKATFLKIDPLLQGQDENMNSKVNGNAWPSNHSHDLCLNIFGAKP